MGRFGIWIIKKDKTLSIVENYELAIQLFFLIWFFLTLQHSNLEFTLVLSGNLEFKIMILGLAPMDWFTDCAMRNITQEIFDMYNKKDTLCLRTEFMTADGYCAKPEAVIRHLMTSPNQKNLIAQIHGGKLETLLKTVKDINKKYAKDFIGIELNLGCPAHNIMKSGGGSELLKNKEETLKIIQALSKASKLPFSIKTRTGLNEADKEAQFDFILKASEYCSMITIHGRTTNKI